MCLDLKTEWKRLDLRALEAAKQAQANFQVCFDGARRGTGEASGGMAVIAHSGSHRKLVFRAGRPFGIVRSAFLVEAMALEWALDVFMHLIVQ